MRWRDLLGYFRTWSALQTFHKRFPKDLRQIDKRFPEDRISSAKRPGIVGDSGVVVGKADVDVNVGGGDIAVRFWKDLREEVKKQGGKYGVDELVSVEWPIALLLAKKL